jgi:hypothetical protein
MNEFSFTFDLRIKFLSDLMCTFVNLIRLTDGSYASHLIGDDALLILVQVHPSPCSVSKRPELGEVLLLTI